MSDNRFIVNTRYDGTEFYGRTGYPLSAAGGVAQYAWNKAGMLYSDSSRGIKRMFYNHMGQPSTVEFTDGGELRYTYSASGELLGVSTYALLAGKRRPVKVSERSYCGDFVFEGDSLAYVNFPGGYFDGNGGAHYRHPDFQGNITMVTGQDGKIEQHTGYYPYGEPWHEPAGQTYLYGGKERMRDGGLNDYDFSARRLNSALALWSTPDPLAFKNTNSNPYVYCSGNPIRYIDPTGCELCILGNDIFEVINQLCKAISGLNLNINFQTGMVSYKTNGEKLNDNSKLLKSIIDDKNINVQLTTQNDNYLENGDFFIGGAFMGNEYDEQTKKVIAKQTINPNDLNTMSNAHGSPGQDLMHEISEAYIGGKIALENKSSYPEHGESNKIYSKAHLSAVPQSGSILTEELIKATYNFHSMPYSTGVLLYYVTPSDKTGTNVINTPKIMILTVPFILNSYKKL